MTNSLMVIHPYLEKGNIWVFDDPVTGLVKEPFVAGIPAIINKIVGDAKEFTAIFSAVPFPGHQHVLTYMYHEYDGDIYKHEATGLTGWLCPALLKYFNEAPKNIYLEVKV